MTTVVVDGLPAHTQGGLLRITVQAARVTLSAGVDLLAKGHVPLGQTDVFAC